MIKNEELVILYESNFKKIYRYFYYKFLNKDLAQDLTSDTFTSFVEATKTNSEGIKNYEKYLFGIAKIIFCEHLKNKYKEPNFVDYQNISDFQDSVTETLEEFKEEITPEEILLKYIELLPAKQKDIIELRLIKKYSLKEIAQILGKNMNYVKTTQRRAIKNLKDIFAINKCTLD